MSYADLGPPEFEQNVWRLKPPGLAWAAALGSVLRGFWNVVADAVAAVHARAAVLSETESFPPSSVELLQNWESVFGLPDPCLGANPVTSARQAAVTARLAATGGQSVPYFVELAANLGSTIAIEEYAPFRFGINCFGQPLYGPAWAFLWTVTLTGTTKYNFEFGVSRFGEPFWQIATGPVGCEITRLAPAHTEVIFTVAPGVESGPFVLGQSQLGGINLLQ